MARRRSRPAGDPIRWSHGALIARRRAPTKTRCGTNANIDTWVVGACLPATTVRNGLLTALHLGFNVPPVGGDRRNQHLVDPCAIQVDDLEFVAVPERTFALGRDVAE